jgi:hypothetical protein
MKVLTSHGVDSGSGCGNVYIDVSPGLCGLVAYPVRLFQPSIKTWLPANGDGVVGGIHKRQVIGRIWLACIDKKKTITINLSI